MTIRNRSKSLILIILATFFLSQLPVHMISALANNSCVSIASDSNGVGQILLQIPPDGTIGIISIRSYKSLLEVAFDELNLKALRVADHSISGAGLTVSGRTHYPSTLQFQQMLQDHCQFVIIGPFLADNRAAPTNYAILLSHFIAQIVNNNPDAHIFLLGFYQPTPAPFVTSNMEFSGFDPESIVALNKAIFSACQTGNSLGKYSRVTCIDTQALFIRKKVKFALVSLNYIDYEALISKPSTFSRTIAEFFTEHPHEMLIGDGYHLNLEGRTTLMSYLAFLISKSFEF